MSEPELVTVVYLKAEQKNHAHSEFYFVIFYPSAVITCVKIGLMTPGIKNLVVLGILNKTISKNALLRVKYINLTDICVFNETIN